MWVNHCRHTPQKFTNVQGEGSQQRQWGGRLGSGEYNGSFFNIAGEPVLPPASSEQPRGKLESVSFVSALCDMGGGSYR